jgi:hypothetical protein
MTVSILKPPHGGFRSETAVTYGWVGHTKPKKRSAVEVLELAFTSIYI